MHAFEDEWKEDRALMRNVARRAILKIEEHLNAGTYGVSDSSAGADSDALPSDEQLKVFSHMSGLLTKLDDQQLKHLKVELLSIEEPDAQHDISDEDVDIMERYIRERRQRK